MAILLLAVHVVASLLLAAYGCHRLYLALRYRRTVAARRGHSPKPGATRLPSVTVQIPLYNERYVATRALAAACALDYPRSLLVIQVLDDSTDETSAVVAEAVRDLRARGVSVHHLRRRARTGYKAGALAHGLRYAESELVAVFDADFVPHPDFLRQLVGEFDDPDVGMVQARWGHLNAETSLLTRVQALQLDAHFAIEHGVRHATGCFFNFNGTAGIWRTQAIAAGGGWRADTLTEDLDLSYRAQLAGWRFVYRDDVEVPAELPVEIAAYRLQQQRWAQGGVQTALKLLPAILGAPIAGRVKLEACWHLTAHFAYPALIVLALAGILGGLWSGVGYRPWVVTVDSLIVVLATTALAFFYGIAAKARGTPGWWRRVGLVVPILIIGAGIAFTQALAVGRGLLRLPTPFRRTPKYRQEDAADRQWRTAAYRLSTLGPALTEFVSGLLILGAGLLSAIHDISHPSGPIFLIGAGFAVIGASGMAQHPRPSAQRKRGRAHVGPVHVTHAGRDRRA